MHIITGINFASQDEVLFIHKQLHNAFWLLSMKSFCGCRFPRHFICKSLPLLNASDQPEFMNKIFFRMQLNKM